MDKEAEEEVCPCPECADPTKAKDIRQCPRCERLGCDNCLVDGVPCDHCCEEEDDM